MLVEGEMDMILKKAEYKEPNVCVVTIKNLYQSEKEIIRTRTNKKSILK